MEYKLKCVFENPVSSNTSGKVSAVPAQSKTEPSTVNGKNKATGDGAKLTDKVNYYFIFIFMILIISFRVLNR